MLVGSTVKKVIKVEHHSGLCYKQTYSPHVGHQIYSELWN